MLIQRTIDRGHLLVHEQVVHEHSTIGIARVRSKEILAHVLVKRDELNHRDMRRHRIGKASASATAAPIKNERQIVHDDEDEDDDDF